MKKKHRKKTSRHRGAEKIFEELKRLYEEMERAYAKVAGEIGLSCTGCEHNCCTSYFQHHTHIEWAYLWRGLKGLEPEKRERFLARAREYEEKVQALIQRGKRIEIMCPLNEGGLCQLYSHRLMICRLHGVPNVVHMPDGTTREFSGCIRCRGLIAKERFFPVMDRTPFYVKLASLEREFVDLLRAPLPKVDHTLSQLLLMGPPPLKGEG